jgi:hypothetical protein
MPVEKPSTAKPKQQTPGAVTETPKSKKSVTDPKTKAAAGTAATSKPKAAAAVAVAAPAATSRSAPAATVTATPAASAKAATPAKVVEAAPAVRQAAPTKPVAEVPKEAAVGKKLVGKPAAPSAEERQRWIATAAYHRAEKRGFIAGYEVQDWLDAEAEVDALIGRA